MGGVTLKIHPLFYLFGLYYALTGRIFIFIVYTIVALVHELGHSFVAERLGYRLKSIVLMPYGVVIGGDVKNLRLRDEIAVAAAGPLLNFAIGIFFVATWWIFPDTYAYTSLAAEANFALFFVNLFPAYPLDGGRILLAALSLNVRERTAERVVRGIGILFSALLFAAFIATIFYQVNFSVLFFAAFLLTGALSRRRENSYVRLFSGIPPEALARGVNVKRIAIDKRASVRRLYALLDASAVNEAEIYDGKQKIRTLSQRELEFFFENAAIYDTIEKTLAEVHRRELGRTLSETPELPELPDGSRPARSVGKADRKRKAGALRL